MWKRVVFSMMQKKDIYISVLVPVYNVPESLLKHCLDSLLEQTLKQAEFILVDDGSTDNSGLICENYAKRDKRIVVKHKKNSGLSATRNTAVSLSSGTYVMFLDSDDYLAPETCEQVYKIINQEDVDVVFWNIKTEYSHSSVVTKPFKGGSRFLSPKEVQELQANVLDFNAKIGQVFAKAIKKRILTEKEIFHEAELRQGAEGIVFNFELFPNVNSAFYLDKTFNHYVYNEQSISHSPNIDNYYLIVECFSFINNLINREHYQSEEKLLNMVKTRLLYVVITTAISGVFNPSNKISYFRKVQEFQSFLNVKIIKKSMRSGDRQELSRQRKVVLWLIDHKFFFSIQILAFIRKFQYKNR